MLALGAVVKALLVGCGLVAAAALARGAMGSAGRRVRRMATDTSPCDAVFRMVRMNVLVAPRTGIVGRAPNVVGGVAVGADVMRGDMPATEQIHVLVTRVARDRLRLLELVRAVATNTLGVSTCEQRRRRNDWALFGVTLDTRRKRRRRGRMLLLVTSRTGLGGSLSVAGVTVLQIFVTVGTRR